MKGQSLEVSPDPVVGVLGGSLEIKWTLKKFNQSDMVSSTRLYNGTSPTPPNLLYEGGTEFRKTDLAKTMFDERIQFDFKDPNYTLKLNNLTYSDKVTFTLVVGTQTSTAPIKFRPDPAIKSVQVQEVRGIYFI